MDAMVVVQQGGKTASVYNGRFEQGGSIVDLVHHRDAAGVGIDAPEFGPITKRQPLCVIIPINQFVGVILISVYGLGNTDWRIAVVHQLGRIAIVENIEILGAAERVCGNLLFKQETVRLPIAAGIGLKVGGAHRQADVHREAGLAVQRGAGALEVFVGEIGRNARLRPVRSIRSIDIII